MKKAVVFVLDAAPSMNSLCDDDDPDTKLTAAQAWMDIDNTKLPMPEFPTRMSSAKQAITNMVIDLMLESKQNEVGIVVCKTQATRHHIVGVGQDLEEEDPSTVPYPNFTELTGGQVTTTAANATSHTGIQRPTIDLLRELQSVQTLDEAELPDVRGGSIVDGITLAGDALFQRTTRNNGKNLLKFERKVVVFTDGKEKLRMDEEDVQVALGGLSTLGAKLFVVGMGFESSHVYEKPADVRSAPDDGNLIEPYLHYMCHAVGGEVVAASTLQQVLAFDKGKKIKTATPYSFRLYVAPDLQVDARSLKLMDADRPTLQKQVVLVDEDGGPMLLDDLGEPTKDKETGQEQLDGIKQVTQYFDEKDPDVMVETEDTTTAIRYGADLLPMDAPQYAGLKKDASSTRTGRRMEILGYMLQSEIPREYRIGPPYAVTGHDKLRACTLIASLAQALERLDKAAICTFHKTERSNAVLGALFPLVERGQGPPVHLVFMQLPFAGEANYLDLEPLADYLEEDGEQESKAKVCDDLIDGLMLPDDVLGSGTVPSPYLRSWNQTVIARAFDPAADLVTARSTSAGDDPMATPPSVVERARPALESFHSAFTLKKSAKKEREEKELKEKAAGGKKAKGRRVLTYTDYL